VRRKFKKFRAEIFVLVILLCLACVQDDNLGGTHFVAPNVTLENFFEDAGQQDFVADSPADSTRILLASFLNPSHPEIHPLRGSFHLSFQPFPFEKKIPLLRC
jgi:hypothetical protein